MSHGQSDSAQHVFVYGSLMFDEVWSRVVDGRYSSVGATLKGYRRHAVRDETYPAVMPKLDAVVQGLVYLDVSKADLLRLDAFEGVEYRRESAQVLDDQGQCIDAQFYLWLLPERALDQDWDLNHFKVEGLARFMNTYVARARQTGRSK